MSTGVSEPSPILDESYAEVRASVIRVQARIERENAERIYVPLDSYPVRKLKADIAEAVQDVVPTVMDYEMVLAEPPRQVNADFALGMFPYAKDNKVAPGIAAIQCATEINAQGHTYVTNASAAGPYVNIEIDRPAIFHETIGGILVLGDRFGDSDTFAGQTVVIDYSAPNIAKPMGVGHLRSTILGESLARMRQAVGYNVVRDNHIGDWGTQFGNVVYALQHWGDAEAMNANPVQEPKRLYVEFTQYAGIHPEVKDEARAIFSQLEQGDPELLALWKRFRDLSLQGFEEVYKQLGIDFDLTIGESFFVDGGAEQLVDDCLSRGLCRQEGESLALVVDEIPVPHRKKPIPSFLLRKGDGTTLYLARDMATLDFRMQAFDPTAVLYVVGSEQALNFEQLLAFARLAGYIPNNVNVEHVGFGLVMAEGGGKMSTRGGNTVGLEELIEKSIGNARELLLKKIREEKSDVVAADVDEVARIIGVGAVIYNDLKQSREKNVTFDWEKMLDFAGGSAVYLQYTAVRINSMLRNVAETTGQIDFDKIVEKGLVLTNESEFNLSKKLMVFPEIIQRAMEENHPHLICGYLEELAHLYNGFYANSPVLNADTEDIRNSRAALSQAVAITLKKGLSLICIEVPEKM